MSDKRLSGSIALITGASRGIGRAVARAYAREGAHLILLARTQGGLEEADDEIRALGASATLIAMDLLDADKVDALGPALYQRFKKLDILVANAAVLGPLSPLAHVKTEDWLKVIDTNLNANFRLIRTLDPLLRESEAGRAIMVTSGAPKSCRAYWGPYSVSKAALDALARTWAAEVDGTRMRVNLLNPGPVQTKMRAEAFPGEDPHNLPAPDALAELFIELASRELKANGMRFEFRPAQTGDAPAPKT
jgi:NAD(P)-dependent dehydrogenase (short-subunit alcohol dehydrogenase family)